jgi:hypothetical protein
MISNTRSTSSLNPVKSKGKNTSSNGIINEIEIVIHETNFYGRNVRSLGIGFFDCRVGEKLTK